MWNTCKAILIAIVLAASVLVAMGLAWALVLAIFPDPNTWPWIIKLILGILVLALWIVFGCFFCHYWASRGPSRTEQEHANQIVSAANAIGHGFVDLPPAARGTV